MTEQDLSLVPGKEHYAAKYLRGGRLFSYAHQLNAVVQYEPQTVIEVGPGPGMVTGALQAIDIVVTTVDIQSELNPDVVAAVTDLPFDNDSFDVAVCCQVLEHLPFDRFVGALRELVRVSVRGAIISLPDRRPHYFATLRLPGLRVDANLGTRPKRVSPDQVDSAIRIAGHYWEIGFPGYPLKRIEKQLSEAECSLVRNWRVPDYPYHHFFILSK
ncbi:methylase involved in ubiquinone/menaquinone biosynthesis [Thioflavicoccus mobilis 8321]|uniref:Methylase involved in ubiquinone/menaquinone biosynthesis n=1 Tax=Thioflavicoccus mobilis 8321 TaxID=765912 RepID=L0H0L0_9GAMM|nr:class I SAM-dependent methyltransferase [Thioflavicoccus mobilis]AGA91761.1 methylase involved in ubiquinone/menaquinone biosynthesis [Thioflavicoccus mobilis 8321]